MKKILAITLSALLVLNLAACSKKTEKETTKETETTTEQTTASETETTAEQTGTPEEYSQAYWEAKYPGYNICPFSINMNGEKYSYFWISQLVGEDDIAAWTKTELNWNGWHLVGDKVVDKDEKWAITDESRKQSFSSCCVYETEPFDASASGGTNETTEPTTTEPAATEPSTTYNFKGYTETADWPDAAAWASLGLPKLTMSDDVNGSVHISDKDWINPLNGSDGVMFEAKPKTSQIAAIVADLQGAGIEVSIDDNYENGFTGYYTFGGNKMKITVSETGTGKLTILVITNPT